MKNVWLYIALVSLTGAVACEEKEKAGGDPSQPTPTPTATRPPVTFDSSPNPVSSMPGLPTTETSPAAGGDSNPGNSNPGNSIPGNTPGNVSGNTPGNTPGNSSGNTPGNGSGNMPGNSPGNGTSSSTPVVVSKEPVPCQTMTVFSTGGNGAPARDHPGPQVEPFDTLVEGTQVNAKALVNEGYVEIDLRGRKAYVHGSFVTCDPAAAAAGQNGTNPEGEAGSAGAAVVAPQVQCTPPAGAPPVGMPPPGQSPQTAP